MKKILMAFMLFAAPCARGHDHVEVGEDPSDATRLGMDGPGFQLALFVPPGEPFSGYVPNFPGGWHASELTFSAEVNALEPAEGSDPYFELVSVNGPAGGSFGFWEVGALAPTWQRSCGWTNTPGDIPTFPVILGGDNHVHGRAFTMNVPGEYTVVCRVIDAAAVYLPSAHKAVTFVALLPPPLSIRIENENAALSFTSRLNLDYDLQSCTNVGTGPWVTASVIFGDGTAKTNTLSISGRSRMFYRLVEYP